MSEATHMNASLDWASSLDSQAFILGISSQGKIDYSNNHFKKYWGFEQDPESFDQIFQNGPGFFDILAQWETGESQVLDFFWTWKLTSPRFPEGRFVKGTFFTPPPPTLSGKSHRQNRDVFFLIFKDVTHQESAKEALQWDKLRQYHQEHNHELSLLASGLAHEVNNPLAIALSKLRLLGKTISSSDLKAQGFISDIEKQLKRIADTTKGFLSHTQTLHHETSLISLTEVIDIVKPLIQGAAESAHVNVEWCTVDERLQVWARKIDLGQVFYHVVLNAVQAAKEQNPAWVKVTTETVDDDFVLVRVLDSGLGISPHVREKMFKPFFTTKSVGQGKGLGLTLSRELIHSMGGNIEYEEFEGHTSFRILIPRRTEALIALIDFKQVIISHLNWKQELLKGAHHSDPSHLLDPRRIGDYTICQLGQWLRKSEASFGHMDKFQQLIEVHKKFHEEARRLLISIMQGQGQFAVRQLEDPYSIYNMRSGQVVSALQELQKELQAKMGDKT